MTTTTHPTDALCDSEIEQDRYVIAGIDNGERGSVLSMDPTGERVRVVHSGSALARATQDAAIRAYRGAGDLMDTQAAYLAAMADDLPDATYGEVMSIGYTLCVVRDGAHYEVVRGGMVDPVHRHVVSAATFRDGWNVAVAMVVAEVRREMAG